MTIDKTSVTETVKLAEISSLNEEQLLEMKASKDYASFLNSIVARDDSVGVFSTKMAMDFAIANGLNFDQFGQLQQVVSDGYLTNTELNSLNGFSQTTIGKLASLTGVVAKDATLVTTSSTGWVGNTYYYYGVSGTSARDAKDNYNALHSKGGVFYKGYSEGGYTGDMATDRIAGVVHGQEYVVNATTTKNLGLNDGSGGVFRELLLEMQKLRTTSETQDAKIGLLVSLNQKILKENEDLKKIKNNEMLLKMEAS